MTPIASQPGGRGRRFGSFAVSACIHGSVLAWVALSPAIPPRDTRSLYEREIRPHEDHIIWYRTSDLLPDVRPIGKPAKRDRRPPKAAAKFDQQVAAGRKEDARPPQLIWVPAPEVETPKLLPLPNIVAVTPQRPPARPFVAPPMPVTRVPGTAPALPEAPNIATPAVAKNLAVEVKPSRPPLRRFTSPTLPRLPDPEPPQPLPAAPEIASEHAVPGMLAAVSKAPRTFVAPPRRPPSPVTPPPAMPAPPELSDASPLPKQPSLVIVGLDPSRGLEVPSPPASHQANFSGGPKPTPAGGTGSPEGAILQVPSLTVAGGPNNTQPTLRAGPSPTSPESLAAVARMSRGTPPSIPNRTATRVASAPDPRLDGRAVYTMAIQMPNITSYSGSWMVWFAEHVPEPGEARADLRPPEAIRKVDPKYIASAAGERVQGKVRLWGVIGTDGRVGSIALLQHLDDRLDGSAEEALGKWLFQPALRNGTPVEVDAIFEIPFYLAPKPAR